MLDNAYEVSREWVELLAEREGDNLVLSISDRGPGFAPEMLSQLGKPYHSSKGRAGGGLGLFLVVNVVRKLGGSVTAENHRKRGASGLACVELLHTHDADMLIVVLTGFASISTAVEAIKLGACHYLAKPSNTDDIEAAFHKAEGNAEVALDARPTSIKTLEWERIHQTLIETDFNISEAARRLGMHRRTLARKLEKRPVK